MCPQRQGKSARKKNNHNTSVRQGRKENASRNASFVISRMCRLGWRNVFLFLVFLQDRRFHVILFYIIFSLVIFVKYDVELRFKSVSPSFRDQHDARE